MFLLSKYLFDDMLTTFDMLKGWSVLQPNRCKFMNEIGSNCFALYIDGSYQLVRTRDCLPSMNGIEQTLLLRSLQQAIASSFEYSIEMKTVRKHRLLYQVWVTHDDVDACGFAEEPDFSDALLRSYLQALEKSEHKWEQEALEKPMFV